VNGGYWVSVFALTDSRFCEHKFQQRKDFHLSRTHGLKQVCQAPEGQAIARAM
jgi:hypothetical protein